MRVITKTLASLSGPAVHHTRGFRRACKTRRSNLQTTYATGTILSRGSPDARTIHHCHARHSRCSSETHVRCLHDMSPSRKTLAKRCGDCSKPYIIQRKTLKRCARLTELCNTSVSSVRLSCLPGDFSCLRKHRDRVAKARKSYYVLLALTCLTRPHKRHTSATQDIPDFADVL